METNDNDDDDDDDEGEKHSEITVLNSQQLNNQARNSQVHMGINKYPINSQ